ncbi:MAG TPA: non-canonical purine NTP pyrophosphatase [Candidatus Peribacteraceae bacterium]|nr:non-canonical purine NTP pyrophosphatase [Candidatus Peribacteraceae bacterium]
MKLLIGTGNKGKIQEMREALAGLSIDVVTPGQLDITDSPAETGETFAENAQQKASFYFERSGIPTIADDSGIIVEALQNELGIHTRRWGKGPDATDHEWVEFFLERMRTERNRDARFVCALAYINEAGELHLFEGNCDGVITDELEADFLPGLPISACFKPNGYDKVFSALSVEEKNSISHRGRALQAFTSFIS